MLQLLLWRFLRFCFAVAAAMTMRGARAGADDSAVAAEPAMLSSAVQLARLISIVDDPGRTFERMMDEMRVAFVKDADKVCGTLALLLAEVRTASTRGHEGQLNMAHTGRQRELLPDTVGRLGCLYVLFAWHDDSAPVRRHPFFATFHAVARSGHPAEARMAAALITQSNSVRSFYGTLSLLIDACSSPM